MIDRYLELLKKSLLDELYLENEARLIFVFNQLMQSERMSPDDFIDEYVKIQDSDLFVTLRESRKSGAWISFSRTDSDGQLFELSSARNIVFVAHTMIGRKRMDNLHDCMNQIVTDKVPGDFIETGAWKGGATIFMRGFLKAHNVRNRKVWVADSFEGLPKSSVQDGDGVDFTVGYPYLSVSQQQVQNLFERYDLFDTQVKLLKGWFKDTLPKAPIKKLALLRLDGDLYESTRDALVNLFHKVSVGGFVIVDDYNAVAGCKLAIDEFRLAHGIEDALIHIDQDSVFWRKTA